MCTDYEMCFQNPDHSYIYEGFGRASLVFFLILGFSLAHEASEMPLTKYEAVADGFTLALNVALESSCAKIEI